jgi:hypothetical protein
LRASPCWWWHQGWYGPGRQSPVFRWTRTISTIRSWHARWCRHDGWSSTRIWVEVRRRPPRRHQPKGRQLRQVRFLLLRRSVGGMLLPLSHPQRPPRKASLQPRPRSRLPGYLATPSCSAHPIHRWDLALLATPPAPRRTIRCPRRACRCLQPLSRRLRWLSRRKEGPGRTLPG